MSIATRMAGRTVRCPACEASFVVPQAEHPRAGEPSTADAPAQETSDPHQSAESPPVRPPESLAADHTTQWQSSRSLAAPPPTESPVRADDDAPRFTLRRPATDFEEMDLTPMVDVTFLLLIFFMITTSFSLQKSLEVPKPEQNDKGAQQSLLMLEDLQSTSIIVQIDERNRISVDYEPVADRYELVGVLEDKRREEQKFELVVEAHPNALHETVVFVVDAANEISMQKIRIATKAVE